MQFHIDKSLPNEPDWIWVFGSNLAGIHGAGAAKVAKLKFGAQHACGKGPTGRAYAIPTKDTKLRPLNINIVESGVRDFLQYASLFPEKRFFVTRVGCGLAGFLDEQIAPMFISATSNCSLPKDWKAFIVSSQHNLILDQD